MYLNNSIYMFLKYFFIKSLSNKYYDKNKNNLEFMKKKAKKQSEYCRKHPEKVKAARKKYYLKNKSKERSKNKIYFQNRLSIINTYRNIPCYICKRMFLPCVMDFHHREPSKKVKNIIDMVFGAYPIEIIIKEIEKCIVICANCHVKFNNKGYKKYPEWFIQYKSTLRCSICNIDYSLEFHHKDPKTKKYNISRLVSTGRAKSLIIDEIKKCRILCRNCHRIEHYLLTFNLQVPKV